MQEILQRIQKLSPDKQKFLARWYYEQQGRSIPPQILPVSQEHVQPGLNQLTLWRRFQQGKIKSVATMSGGLLLKGLLNPNAFHNSLGKIVARHQILRSYFVNQGDCLTLVVEEGHALNYRFEQQTGLEPGEKEELLQQAWGQAKEFPFEPQAPPLYAFRLIQLAPEEFAFFYSFHHLVFDGWSGGVFFTELCHFYNEVQSGQSPNLPELAVQYNDYAFWRAWWQQSVVKEKCVATWRVILEDYVGIIDFSALRKTGNFGSERRVERSLPCIRVDDFPFINIAIPLGRTNGLKEICHQLQISLFMLLATLFAIVLYFETGQEDLVIAFPIAGRFQQELETMIGYFANTLPLRIRVNLQQRLETQIMATKHATVQTYQYQETPLETLVTELGYGANKGQAPLYQVMLALQDTPSSATGFTDITIQPIRKVGASNVAPILKFYSHFDCPLTLTLALIERAGELQGMFEYNPQVLDTEMVNRFSWKMMRLIQLITEEPSWLRRPNAELIKELAE